MLQIYREILYPSWRHVVCCDIATLITYKCCSAACSSCRVAHWSIVLHTHSAYKCRIGVRTVRYKRSTTASRKMLRNQLFVLQNTVVHIHVDLVKMRHCNWPVVNLLQSKRPTIRSSAALPATKSATDPDQDHGRLSWHTHTAVCCSICVCWNVFVSVTYIWCNHHQLSWQCGAGGWQSACKWLLTSVVSTTCTRWMYEMMSDL